jgi:hypothetical protein
MANYLQRVIASGALTGMAERPPAYVSPAISIALIPPAPMAWESEEPVTEPGFTPLEQTSAQLKPAEPISPAPQALPPAPTLRAVLPEERPKSSQAKIPKTPERDVGSVTPASSAPPLRRPEPDAIRSPTPRLAQLPGFAPGPRIRAPKALRPPVQHRQHESAASTTDVEFVALGIRPAAPEVPVTAAPVPAKVAPKAIPPNRSERGPEPIARFAGESRTMTTQPSNPRITAEIHRWRGLPEAASADKERVQERPAIPPAPIGERTAPVAASIVRPARISIGRVKVKVNNRPAAPPRAPKPSRAVNRSQLNSWDTLGIDRFSIKL